MDNSIAVDILKIFIALHYAALHRGTAGVLHPFYHTNIPVQYFSFKERIETTVTVSNNRV